ncbi:GRP2 [Candida pseudojiufengensis]|uniref:GRP2 n=1 Tax=Candida pseudojiufengensis TaxID=497109 RepID=UPI0022250A0A|nr:GRP2 [Candida pseudojiufengensis]KAI5966444.1 GRP2 [Candida pseudojiufengensis]
MSSQKIVFVSGATGFIAQHIVKQLIEKGYKTIGSVRSTEKGEDLKSLLQEAGLQFDLFSYEIVKDITAKGAFDQALKSNPDITDFLHTASPFFFDVKDVEKELLKPAIEGTVNALNAIYTYGKNVERVAITSSYAAVAGFGDLATPGKEVNEESWNPITYDQAKSDGFTGYIGSKKLANEKVVEFIKEHNPQWAVTVICPVFVFGPQAFEVKDKSKLNTSNEVINAIIKAGKEGTDVEQQLVGYFIDVRDVAHAHVKVVEPGNKLANQRLLLSEGPVSTQKIYDIIKKDFPQVPIPKLDPSKAPKFEDSESIINNKKTRELLGFKFIGLEESIDDTIKQII